MGNEQIDFQETIFKKAIKKSKNDNLLISPMSLFLPLALISKGAKDKTLNEFLKALNDSKNENLYLNNLEEISTILKKDKNLKIANSILSKVNIEDNFLKQIQNFEIKTDKLENLEQINNWVKEKTEGKIDKFIDKLDPSTLIVILNAIYFHDDWKEEFEHSETSQQLFYLANNKQKEVDFMNHIFDNAFYYQTEIFQSIKLEYKNSDIMATIILPSKNIKINDFVANMNSNSFFDISNYNTDRKKVKLYLPKIKLESSCDLKELLEQLGIKEAFSIKADFSLISSIKPLFIGNVFQKTCLEMDEKGTTGSSATEVEMTLGVDDEPIEMKCDRPYLVFLSKYSLKMKKDIILFAAKIENP